jgi:hypothetical protein
MAQFVHTQQTQMPDSSTVGKIGTITQGVGGLLSAIDQAMHPEKYQTPQPSGQNGSGQNNYYPQARHSGMSVGSIILLTAAAGGAVWAGKEFLGKKKKSKK